MPIRKDNLNWTKSLTLQTLGLPCQYKTLLSIHFCSNPEFHKKYNTEEWTQREVPGERTSGESFTASPFLKRREMLIPYAFRDRGGVNLPFYGDAAGLYNEVSTILRQSLGGFENSDEMRELIGMSWSKLDGHLTEVHTWEWVKDRFTG